MNEEIKEIIYDIKDSLNETPKKMYKYNKITLNLNEFEEILNYIEQLEDIRKEVIEYIKDNACYSEGHCKCSFSQIALDNLLNILNKGENNE